jgi:hypothetical protein
VVGKEIRYLILWLVICGYFLDNGYSSGFYDLP